MEARFGRVGVGEGEAELTADEYEVGEVDRKRLRGAAGGEASAVGEAGLRWGIDRGRLQREPRAVRGTRVQRRCRRCDPVRRPLPSRPHPGVRAQVGEHLAQARRRLLGAGEGPVLAARVVKVVLPAAVTPRHEVKRRLSPTEAPNDRRKRQSAAPANARAVGTTKRRSSGDAACRSTQAGASSSKPVLEPTNHALAVEAPYASTIMRAA